MIFIKASHGDVQIIKTQVYLLVVYSSGPVTRVPKDPSANNGGLDRQLVKDFKNKLRVCELM